VAETDRQGLFDALAAGVPLGRLGEPEADPAVANLQRPGARQAAYCGLTGAIDAEVSRPFYRRRRALGGLVAETDRQGLFDALAAGVPLGRLGEPEEIGRTVSRPGLRWDGSPGVSRRLDLRQPAVDIDLCGVNKAWRSLTHRPRAAYCAPSCFISVRLSSICQLAVILPLYRDLRHPAG
jgi:hypothetical protein